MYTTKAGEVRGCAGGGGLLEGPQLVRTGLVLQVMGLQLYEIHSVSSGRQPGLLFCPYLTSRVRQPPAGELLVPNPPSCPFTTPFSLSSLTSLLVSPCVVG